MLLLGLWLVHDSFDFLGRAVETEGEVVRLAETRSDSGVVYAPVFAFRTHEGDVVEVTHNISSNPPSWRVGDRTELLYDSTEPKEAMRKSWFGVWLMPVAVTVGGAVTLALAFVCAIARSRIRAG